MPDDLLLKTPKIANFADDVCVQVSRLQTKLNIDSASPFRRKADPHKVAYSRGKGRKIARRTLLIAYIATYLAAIGSAIRFLVRPRDSGFWSDVFLTSGYLVLLIAEPFLFRQNRTVTVIYLVVQIAIVSALALITRQVHFWTALFLPVFLQVMDSFRRRTGFFITSLLTFLMAVLIFLGLGPEAGLPFILINGVFYFFLVAFIATVRDAEVSRQEAEAAREGAENARIGSEKQRAELQTCKLTPSESILFSP